jgi:Sap, sulfolipid-1-addressing protein
MRWGAEPVPEIIPLAFAAAVYPPLLAGIIILLARDKPVAMLAAFMAGGMLVTFVLGLLIVFVLGDWLSNRSQNSTSPIVDIVIGVLSLVGAFVLHQRIRERQRGVVRAAKKPKDGPSRTQVMLNEGTPWAAFAAGLILNLPGIWYLDALKDIADSNPSTATVIVDILIFIVIMFSLAELPLIGYMVAPEATQLRVASFQAWMSRNGRTVGMWAAVLIGLYLLIKGIVNAA